MITTKMLYKHMKNFLSKDDARPVFQHLCFKEGKVIATNCHVLTIVKDYKADEHYETPDGARVADTDDWKMPNYAQVIPKSGWKAATPVDKPLLDAWKAALDFVVKITRKNGYPECYLEYKDNWLVLYAVSDELSVKSKFVLLELSSDEEWGVHLNPKYLLNAIKFLQDTDPLCLEILVNPTRTILSLETDDLQIIQTVIRHKIKNALDAFIEE